MPLKTADRQEAARRAAKVFAEVRSAGWQVDLATALPGIAERLTDKLPTIGELITAAKAASADAHPRTLNFYAQCLRNLAAAVFNIESDRSKFDYRTGGRAAWLARVDRIRLDKLTPARVQAVLNARITAHRGNPLAEQRARTTAATTCARPGAYSAPG